jgi:nucleoside-diphosphate-sugar epimerase/2-polyprenyl-3-methyl-5-hydroxy-6-metoxy-1,4-benzoquinol methylase
MADERAMSGKRVLVTGAAGLVGYAVVSRLVREGADVVPVDAPGVRAELPVPLVAADLVTGAWPEGPWDAIVHCAAQVPMKYDGPEAEAAERANRAMDDRAIELAAQTRAHLVFLSSGSVYGATIGTIDESTPPAPTLGYSHQKLSTERAIAARGDELSATVFRLVAPYGPRQHRMTVLLRFLELALSGAPLRYYGTGSRTQDFIHVDDVASAVFAAITRRANGVFVLASGTPIAMRDLAALVVSATKSTSAVEAAGVADPEETKRITYDTRKLRDELAFRPSITLEEGVAAWADGRRGAAWHIPKLPFIYRPLETPENGHGLPNALPFIVTLDASTGLVRQRPTPAVAEALDRAYQVGSEIPGLMEAQGIGREYADDFLSLLEGARGQSSLAGLRVLEIGCGTGYLLSRMRDLGAEVLGVEPGPHGQSGAKEHGVPVVQGFFPCAGVSGEFDLIVMYLVLEHLPDPTTLVSQARAHLRKGGRVAIVVPDAEPFLEEGDVSTLFHEHYSYFTAASLATTLRKAAATSIRVRRSSLSKLLFATFGFDPSGADDVAFDRTLESSCALARAFEAAVKHTTKQLCAYLDDARTKKQSVGVYVPGRFVNYVAMADLDIGNLRFFDDSAAMLGRFFPGVNVPVENRDDLVARPPARVLVMSKSFGKKIKERIVPLLPSTTQVTTLDEL